jgi:hypothetical protein
MSFDIIIKLEDPTGAWTVGPITSEMQAHCTGYGDAHEMLDRILLAFGIDEAAHVGKSLPGMGSVQDGPLT